MTDKTRTYRLTKSGRDAWESEDAAVPSDYRRILWLMDFQGHAGLTGTMLKSISRSMLDDWLGEMEEIGLIEPVPEGEETGADFASSADRTLKLTDLDRRRLKQDTLAASRHAQGEARPGRHRQRPRARRRRLRHQAVHEERRRRRYPTCAEAGKPVALSKPG